MATINYSSVIFDETAGTITLKGDILLDNATDTCTRVAAKIITNSLTIEKSGPVTPGAPGRGNWEIIYSGNEIQASFQTIRSLCGTSIKINSFCTNTPSQVHKGDHRLVCEGAQQCPEVVVTVDSISNQCINGKRTVTFNVSVSNPTDPLVYEIDFGDGEHDNVVFDGSANTLITHEYEGGNYNVSVNIVFPEGCADSNTVLVTVPPCTQNCPADISLEIIDGGNNRFTVLPNGLFQSVTNPASAPVTCLPAGSYTIRVTDPSESGLRFIWREDQNSPQQENSSPDFPVQLNFNSNKSVTVIVKKTGCTDVAETIVLIPCPFTLPIDCQFTDTFGPCVNGQRTVTRTITTPAQNGGRPCPPLPSPTVACPPTSCDACCIWFILNVVLTMATFIAVVIAGCVLQWNEPVWNAIAVSLIIATALSWILWGIFCLLLNPAGFSCQTLRIFIDILDWLEFVFGIIAIALLSSGHLPCAAAFAINWGLTGGIRRLLKVFAQITGCLPLF